MDGLECSEVLLSEVHQNKDSRIDSAFYTMRLSRNNTLRYEPIEKGLLLTQYGVSKDMNADGIGFPIFRMNELHYGLCDMVTDKSVELTAEEFEKICLRDGDVLFNRTNSYEKVGRTGIYYSHGTPQTFASYLVRFVPDNELILSEYLAAFLNTKFGIQEIRRRSRPSINQTNVNPEEVKRIQIPILRKELQQCIRTQYKLADCYRVTAMQKYSEAEAILSNAIDIRVPGQQPPVFTEKPFSKSFLTTGRLDAEYYQPKYETTANQIHSQETVNSICRIHDENYLPQEDIEYKYIELANVGKSGDISDVEKIVGKELPTRARRIVSAGQVIISSIEGSLQSCALIEDEYNGALCSTGFYVLDSGAINSETLLVLFKSEPIQALLKQRCSGTILTAISKDELLSMPLPVIDETVQKMIAEKVQESCAFRRKSKELLEIAKQAVEVAIEQGEDAAMSWLKEKINPEA